MSTEKTDSLWMSFCDPDKKPGERFLGVIIVRGITNIVDAAAHAWDLGINPGGEVQGHAIDGSLVKPEHFDRLLSADELREAGYIE